jgi:hypothetical protein
MCDRAQRYGDAPCPSEITETSCMSHVRPAPQVTFHVFGPEKCIPSGKYYLSVHCTSGATTSILFSGKCGNCAIGDLPSKPVVNTTILA